MAKQINGVGAVVGVAVAVVAALGVAVGCSDGFASGDCHANRTCESSAGDKGAGGSPVEPSDGGADSGVGGTDSGVGGTDSMPLGGAPPVGGAADAMAGAGGDGECHTAADCSNGDPLDGEEGCNRGVCGAGNPPPTVVSVTPNDAAVAVEPDTKVVIQFSEPLDDKTVTKTTVSVSDGETAVPGELTYSGKSVTFTPTSPLALLAPYKVSVTTGVHDKEGAALLDDYSSVFSVRDGAWKTIDAVKDKISNISDALPISATGSVLLAWSGTAGLNCPVSASWFLRGVATTTASFPIANQVECYRVSSASNAAGVAAVDWEEPDVNNGSDVQQYRAGAWQAVPERVSKNFSSYNNTVAVAPSGVITFFEHSGGGARAWTTNAAGEWPEEGEVLSSYTDESRTRTVFDSDGNGLAVWRAKDPAGGGLERIVSSRFTKTSGKWAVALDLPGSAIAVSSAENGLGTPAVAMDSDGNALALWVNASSGSKLMASRFVQATGWSSPESISGALLVEPVLDSPALVFDGHVFVAAWTAQESGKRYAYTARRELTAGWDAYTKQQVVAADGTSALHMPRLASDGRGNLLLVFARGASPTYTLVYQRYTDDKWGPITAVPGGTITDQSFESELGLPLAMNADGLAALSWVNRDSLSQITGIRLASFY